MHRGARLEPPALGAKNIRVNICLIICIMYNIYIYCIYLKYFAVLALAPPAAWSGTASTGGK